MVALRMTRKKLREALYTPPDFDVAVDYLIEMSETDSHAADRVIGILGVVLLEDAIEVAISRKLVPEIYAEYRHRIFDGGQNGPLSTFDARILLAYALGIYGQRTFRALNEVKLVRNAFAHSAQPLHFGHSLLGNLLLDAPEITLQPWETTKNFRALYEVEIKTPRQRFILQIIMLATCIQIEVHTNDGKRYKRRPLP
jgi:DNA-binding MltR family transcriptional regulator